MFFFLVGKEAFLHTITISNILCSSFNCQRGELSAVLGYVCVCFNFPSLVS